VIQKIQNKLLLFIFILSSLPIFILSQTQPRKMSSSQLKALYIYKFTTYVIWPNEDNMKEFVICVMSSEDLHNQLKGIGNIAKFKNKIPIKVVYCKTINDIQPNCQMLVVDGSRNDNLWSVYSKIRGKGVLMVAEKLPDYKKSMISFAETGGRIKYIINKPKLEESNLTVKAQLYESAIVKEGEWKSIFDKLDAIASSGDGVSLDRNEVKKLVTSYKTLEEEKKAKEAMILQMEDTLRLKMEVLKGKQHEYDQVSSRIEEQKALMEQQDIDIRNKKEAIDQAAGTIGTQKKVISIIAILSALGIILLLFTIRSNNQRRKANKLLSEQKNEIEKQKHLVDEKQKEIVDSINYAKRIQTALMANDSLMQANLNEYFVMFNPKDIVAGDFYWATRYQDSFIYITADSTGHGVPGAFMSLLNISKLNDAINQKITRPDLVLNEVKSGIIRALNPEGSSEESKDGMDAILCKLDTKNMKLQYAAANNSFCIIRKGTIINLKADKMPVGKSHDDSALFTFNEIDLEKGDMIYTFTDGYGDQFGGPDGKKFMHKQLRQIFVDVADKHIDRQKEIITSRFTEWKGHLEQVDDVLIIGVRV
jgi:serine phosphatase RsbU (regulator of sigma subunit)